MENAVETYVKKEVFIRPMKLEEELSFKNVVFNHRKEYGVITEYIDDFLEGNTINRYLLLPGIRDTGKSTILFQLYEYLLKEKGINSKNILYLSVDNLKKMTNSSIYDGVSTYMRIFFDEFVETIKEPVFLLIDEAQYDEDWSLTGKIIFDNSKNVFMIFSGSSSLELSYNADSARRLLRIPITPLTYAEHLNLKYDYPNKSVSDLLYELIYDYKTENIIQLNDKLSNYKFDIGITDLNSWTKFLQFGGLPSYFYQKEKEVTKKLIDTIDKTVTMDMKNIEGMNKETENLTFNILYYFALQNMGEVSLDSLANNMDSNKNTIKKVLGLLERTQLIFSITPFTSSAKKVNKPKKYYFATSSLRHVLSSNVGNSVLENKNVYYGKLLENYVASTFFNLNIKKDVIHNVYYDDNKKSKKNVDFILQRGIETPIPVEVSYGKKNKSQIKGAMRRYHSDYGIIISGTTSEIVLDDNIIYIPHEFFAFL